MLERARYNPVLVQSQGDPMKNHEMMPAEGSFWLKTCPATDFPTLEGGLEVDVVVLGGGIAGITTATLLKDAGLTVAVLEADRIVKDVTVGTTAKISAAPTSFTIACFPGSGRLPPKKLPARTRTRSKK